MVPEGIIANPPVSLLKYGRPKNVTSFNKPIVLPRDPMVFNCKPPFRTVIPSTLIPALAFIVF